MAETNILKKDQSKCVFAIGLIMACYAGVRLVEIFAQSTKSSSLVLAMICTLALAVVYFIISKTSNAFYGLLAGIIGYKMMPPVITTLINHTTDGAVLYYLVRKAAVVLFVLLIIKLYRMQKDDDKIKLIPILAIMVVVPFCSEVGRVIGTYLTNQLGGSMIPYYFTCYAFYIIAAMVILYSALKSNYATLRFTCYFEFIALAINTLKKIAVIVAFAIKGNHISKDYFVWIVVFVALMAVFALIKNNRKKAELNK